MRKKGKGHPGEIPKLDEIVFDGKRSKDGVIDITTTVTHISRQVSAAYRDRKYPNLPIPLNIFDAGPNCCLLIFCILHMIGRGDLINAFAEENKVDSQLPLPPDDVASIFRTTQASHLAALFAERQHRFCPARFEYLGNLPSGYSFHGGSTGLDSGMTHAQICCSRRLETGTEYPACQRNVVSGLN